MDIYVGSLPFKMKEEDLRETFEEFGEVSSAKIVMDKMTRQSKGFGFVEMPNEAEAKDAIAKLHGQEIMGRELIVNESQNTKRTDGFRPGGGGGGRSGGGGSYQRRDGGGDRNRDRPSRDGGGDFKRRDRDD
jgi:RNA recognition motif-containing protein